MAKKKTIDLREPTPVPAGDVNIIYQGTRIGGFSEDTEAVLKTAGCRVEHDIAVNYTKPEQGIMLPKIIVSGNTVEDVYLQSGSNNSPLIISDTNGYIRVPEINCSAESGFVGYISPFFDDGYRYNLLISSRSDSFNITINETSVPFDRNQDGYVYAYSSATYPTDVNIVINNKEG